MKSWDVIVIGAGHNGLVNACYLQRAGLDVLVVEKNDWIGGAAASRSLTPGFTYSNCSYVCSLFRPEIMRDLELPRHGLQVIAYEGGAVFTRDGDYLANYRDHDAHRREFARFSVRDAEAYDRYSRDVTRQCRFIQPLLMRTAPDPTSFRPRDLGELMYLGRKFASLGADEMARTLRFWTMSIADFLDEYFETDVIKAYFALSGIIGTALGPMSPGTAYILLHHYMGEVDGSVGAWGFARGGMGAVSNALASSFKASGGTIRTDAGVDRVIVRDGKAQGVVLTGGEEIRAKMVVSNADAAWTYQKLVAPEHRTTWTDAKLAKAKHSMSLFVWYFGTDRTYDDVAHHTILLGERYKALLDDIFHKKILADDFSLYLHRPTATDPSMAPAGHDTFYVLSPVPHLDSGTDWATETEVYRRKVEAYLEATVLPGLSKHVTASLTLTPQGFLDDYLSVKGAAFSLEPQLMQSAYMRPHNASEDVDGLYLVGAGTHPGAGMPGVLSSARVLDTVVPDPADLVAG